MKNTLTYLLLLLSTSSMSQNLVPNPSFEDTITCPTMLGQVTKANLWYDLLNTPDYFHSCSVIPQVSVPNNFVGFQYPASGQAYMGGCDYDLIDTNYREIIGSNLLNPLIIGTKYFVNFKVSFSGGIFQAVNIATDKMGILFSTVDYISSPPPIANFCQVFSNVIISDSLNWTTIRGSLLADSAYSFISIGNFFKNYLTDTVNLNPNNHTRGYYYIDDVCISDDSLYCELWTGLSQDIFKDALKIYPNPTNKELHIDNIPRGCTKIIMYDVNGKKVLEISTDKKFKTVFNLSPLNNGIYSLIFQSKNNIFSKKIIYSNL